MKIKLLIVVKAADLFAHYSISNSALLAQKLKLQRCQTHLDLDSLPNSSAIYCKLILYFVGVQLLIGKDTRKCWFVALGLVCEQVFPRWDVYRPCSWKLSTKSRCEHTWSQFVQAVKPAPRQRFCASVLLGRANTNRLFHDSRGSELSSSCSER